MIVMDSLSYNSQEHPSTLQFYRRLRQDYHALTRYLAQKRVRELEAEARQAVLQQLRGVGRVSLAVDGSDHQQFPTLAFTVITPLGKTFLWKFARVNSPETGEFLEQEVRKVVDELASCDVRVISAIGDNASNLQKGLKLASFEGLITLNCFALSGNLILKEIAGLFQRQWDQMGEMESFFQSKHAPRLQYAEVQSQLGGVSTLCVFFIPICMHICVYAISVET